MSYVPAGMFGPSGYARAPRITPFDEVFWHFVRGHDCYPYAARGYKSKDGGFFIDNHLIAQRRYGKVQMFLTMPEAFRYAVANAIRKVKRECDEHNLHLRICGEHEDCRGSDELGVACWLDRHPEDRPPHPIPETKKENDHE